MVKADGDTSNYDEYPDDHTHARAISRKDMMQFEDF